jgi:hypothetical protein
MRTAINKLHHSPVVLNNDIHYLTFSIGECLTPAIVIVLIGFWARLQLASGNILKLTIFSNYSSTTVRVPQVPGFVEYTYNPFSFSHKCRYPG